MRSMRASALFLGAAALLAIDVGSADAGGRYTRNPSDLHALSASPDEAQSDEEHAPQAETTGSDESGDDGKVGDTSGDE